MIDYQKGFLGLPSFFYWYGSVVPRCLLPAAISAVVTSCIIAAYEGSEYAEGEADLNLELKDAAGSGLSALNVIVGFLVVFRAQQGYAR